MSVHLFLAYFVSGFGGWLLAGTAVWAMRWTIGRPREFFRWLDVWVGITERWVITTLLIWAPQLTPAFVGGWLALKLAANWQRRTEPGAQQMTLVALVGSVISFSVAIWIGLDNNPAALKMICESSLSKSSCDSSH